MKVIKVLALVLLVFLLFLSLSIFSVAFTLNSTVLNADFYAREMDRVDVSSLIEEPVSEWTAEEGLSDEFRVALISSVDQMEPAAKERVASAIRPVLDYLKGKSQSLDLAAVLGDTVLDPDFIVSLVEKADIPALAGEIIGEQVAEETSLDRDDVTMYAEEVMVEVEPWLKDQIGAVAGPVIDYLLGKSQSLDVVVSLEPLAGGMRTVFLRSPPQELAGRTQAELGQYFDDNIRQILPETFEVDEDTVGSDVPQDIAQGLAEAEEGLAQARDVIGYFRLGYWLLLLFILLLIAGIALICWQVRSASLMLGIILLASGVIFFAGNLVTRYFVGGLISGQPDIPAQIQSLMPQMVGDFLNPLVIYSVILAVIGAALLAVYFICKSRQAQA